MKITPEDKVGVKRLLKLADLLETVPPERFDMGRWGDRDFKANACGTKACAGGWATTDKYFRRAGLYFDSVEKMVIFMDPSDGRVAEQTYALELFFSYKF